MPNDDSFQETLAGIDDFRKEALRNISYRTDIEKIIGNEPFNEEKSRFLGMNSGDILYQYTFDDLDLPATYEQIADDMSDPEVGKVVIHSHLISEVILKIVKEAQKNQLSYTVVNNPQFKGDMAAGLVRKEKP